MVALVAGIVRSATIPLYAPGALLHEATGRRVGTCVDVAVDSSARPHRQRFEAHWTYGNRCHREVSVELARVRVWLEDPHGAPFRLPETFPTPPVSLGAMRLGALDVTYVQFEWVAALRPRRICFDVARAVPDARGPAPAPVCMPLAPPDPEPGA